MASIMVYMTTQDVAKIFRRKDQLRGSSGSSLGRGTRRISWASFPPACFSSRVVPSTSTSCTVPGGRTGVVVVAGWIPPTISGAVGCELAILSRSNYRTVLKLQQKVSELGEGMPRREMRKYHANRDRSISYVRLLGRTIRLYCNLSLPS